jgi:enoyl-CoA hydratase
MNPPMIVREDPAEGVARVVLNRPEHHNAQNLALLYELDTALSAAARDRAVKVIVLSANGPDFSSGHDVTERHPLVPPKSVATTEGVFDADGIEGRHAFECEAYLGLCRRWRDIPKPTIGQAHGRTIAAGLMLLWPMDLIVAGESATFSDPVAAFGLNGHEYFVHPWEVGARKAKEMLFTGEPFTAAEAHRLGMVNHVVPDDDLTGFTLDLAARIAQMPEYGLRLAKTAVNNSLAAQGQGVAIDSAFALHIAGHANNLTRYSEIVDPAGIERIRALSRRRTNPK